MSRVESQYETRLTRDLNRMAKEAGRVLEVDLGADGLAREGWLAVFDTELAALRVFYVYRWAPDVRLGVSVNPPGWYLSVGRS